MGCRAMDPASVKSSEFFGEHLCNKALQKLAIRGRNIRTEERYFPRALQSPISIGPFHTSSSHNPVCYLTKLDSEVILKTSRREYTFLDLSKES